MNSTLLLSTKPKKGVNNMFCKNCGNEIKNNARVCDVCGMN